MNATNIRLLSQQLVSPQFRTAYEVVEWMGAMQAQEYRMMRWAVGMRMKSPSMESLEKDFNEGRIIRSHLFRTTWQLVAAEDFRWMTELCGERNIKAVEGFLKSYGRTLSEKEYQKGNEIIEELLQNRDEITIEDAIRGFAEKDIETDRHTVSIHLRRAEFEGLICSGTLTPKTNTYALTSRKIHTTSLPSKEEAISMLARKYFRSHSPDTLEDFVWWSGLRVKEARNGINAIKDEFGTANIDGAEYFIHQNARTKGMRGSDIHLLPSYDEYLIAYKSRHIALDPAWKHRAHDNKGIFWPVILKDGIVSGNWNITKKGIGYDLFDGNDTIQEEEIRSEQDRVMRFYDKK